MQGTVEVRKSFDNRYSLEAAHKHNHLPLEEHLSDQGSIRATETCVIACIACADLDYLMQWSSKEEFQIYHLEDGATILKDDALIDDDFQEDWDEVFFQSELANNLSSAAKHQLFSNLIDVEVRAGQEIIKQNTSGDYFYIIKKGIAQVITPKNGPFAGKRFDLTAGQYFGDEALIADTPRNASVTMVTDGLLGKLKREQFNGIIKAALVPSISRDNIDIRRKPQFIDVRLPFEFQNGKSGECCNIPVSVLRKQLARLDQNTHYYVTPDGGRRSELATYLMRQAGLQAFCLAQ